MPGRARGVPTMGPPVSQPPPQQMPVGTPPQRAMAPQVRTTFAYYIPVLRSVSGY